MTATTIGVKQDKKSAKPARRIPVRSFDTHQDLLDDMAAFGKKTSATPGGALAFLIGAGLLTRAGKPKRLIRD